MKPLKCDHNKRLITFPVITLRGFAVLDMCFDEMIPEMDDWDDIFGSG